MGIIVQGIELNQKQLDAIVPVINDHMIGRISRKKFEGACLEAMDKAGCPLIPDTDDDADEDPCSFCLCRGCNGECSGDGAMGD